MPFVGPMARVTIEDVAEKAGVSVATVNRALQDKARVRPANAARVEAAVRTLNYQPDRLAARLAKGRDYRFCFVMPRGDNAFMASLENEIVTHSQLFAADRVIADILATDVFDPRSLSRSLASLKGYDGVAVVALDHPEIREAINDLTARGVEVVTLVSDVPGSSRCHYVGIDNSAAGRTAATLMGRYIGRQGGKIGVIAGSLGLRDHAERHFGFEQVMLQEYPQLQLLPVREGRDKSSQTASVTSQLLKDHPDLVGIYCAGAGTDGVVDAVRASRRPNALVVVAHELTGQSRAALLDGTIDAVIAQDPGHEIRSAMRVLMARCDKQPVIAAQERISVDIFVRDNLP